MILTWGNSRSSLDPEIIPDTDLDLSLETRSSASSSLGGTLTPRGPAHHNRLSRHRQSRSISYLHSPIGRPQHRSTTTFAQPRPISTMSRATNRPTHIPLPNSPFAGRSPNASPLPTPAAVSPTSPRSSFIPSFIRTRSRAATLTGAGRGRSSPSAEIANPINSSAAGSQRPAPSASVTRSVSTPQSGGLSAGESPSSLAPHIVHDLMLMLACRSGPSTIIRRALESRCSRRHPSCSTTS